MTKKVKKAKNQKKKKINFTYGKIPPKNQTFDMYFFITQLVKISFFFSIIYLNSYIICSYSIFYHFLKKNKIIFRFLKNYLLLNILNVLYISLCYNTVK